MCLVLVVRNGRCPGLRFGDVRENVRIHITKVNTVAVRLPCSCRSDLLYVTYIKRMVFSCFGVQLPTRRMGVGIASVFQAQFWTNFMNQVSW
jgi:hypothetical protein